MVLMLCLCVREDVQKCLSVRAQYSWRTEVHLSVLLTQPVLFLKRYFSQKPELIGLARLFVSESRLLFPGLQVNSAVTGLCVYSSSKSDP